MCRSVIKTAFVICIYGFLTATGGIASAIGINERCGPDNCGSPDIIGSDQHFSSPFSFIYTLANTHDYPTSGSLVASNNNEAIDNILAATDNLQYDHEPSTSDAGVVFEGDSAHSSEPAAHQNTATDHESHDEQSLHLMDAFYPTGHHDASSAEHMKEDETALHPFGDGSDDGAAISSSAPEPGGMLLMAAGCGFLLLIRRARWLNRLKG